MARPTTLSLFSPRNVFIFVAAFGMVTGWRAGNQGLWTMGVGSACIAAAAGIQSGFLLRRVRVHRFHPQRVFQGEDVDLEVRVEIEPPLAQGLVEVVDSFPPGGAGALRLRSLFADVWKTGRAHSVGYRRACDRSRGMYVLGPVELHAADPLGLFPRECIQPEFTTLLVYPQATELRSLELLEEGTRRHAGLETVAQAGQGEEFTGLREWHPGEPLRRVHWAKSLRLRQRLVKQFEDERTTEVTILLDLHRLGQTGLGDQTTAEYAVQAAATIARRAYERGHQFQLVACAARLEHLPPGGGYPHLIALLDRLVFLKAEGEHDIVEEIARARAWIARGSTAAIILSATRVELDRLAPVLETLRRDRVRLLLLLVDDRAFPKLYREQEMAHIHAMPLEELVSLLRQLGAHVHVLGRHPEPAEGVRRGLELEAIGSDGSAEPAAPKTAAPGHTSRTGARRTALWTTEAK